VILHRLDHAIPTTDAQPFDQPGQGSTGVYEPSTRVVSTRYFATSLYSRNDALPVYANGRCGIISNAQREPPLLEIVRIDDVRIAALLRRIERRELVVPSDHLGRKHLDLSSS
jgi:hypothetical protein